MADIAIDLSIAEHLAARLCHELVSSVGAISNGLELIEDEPDFSREAGKLIGDSARTAARRLQFYRVAYGATAGVTDERARAATIEFFAEGKVVCVWPADVAVLTKPFAPGDISRLIPELCPAAKAAQAQAGSSRLNSSLSSS